MTSRLAMRCRLRNRSQLHWHSWGDQFVVYDSGSGDTHLLDPIAAEVLRCLSDSPLTLAEVVAQIAVRTDSEVTDELVEYLEELMSELDELALVELSDK